MDRNSTRRFRNPPTGSIRRVRGFTLVELMISVTIGLVLVAGLATVFASSSGSSRINDRLTEIAFNGRYTIEMLKREVRQAGYRGYTWAEPNTPSGIGTITGECGDGTGAFATNIRQGIWGANDSNPLSTCIPASEKDGAAGGDILVLRRVSGPVTTALQANTLYFRSSYASGEVFRGTTVPTSMSTAAAPTATFAVNASVYYVRPYTNDANEVPRVPALARVVVQTDGSMGSELVASGVEQLQVQYGRRNTAAAIQFYNSFDSGTCATCYLDTSGVANTPTVWDEVDSVRLWVLVRASTTEPGYTNNTSYVMGDQTYTFGDGYRRELFTATVQLRN